jgi:hypothetical protein
MCFVYVEGSISRENKTPFQKLMFTVNCGSLSDSISETLTKKDLVGSLDRNILQIENKRARIERLEEACNDIVDDVRQSNHANKTNIPETFITRLDQIETELGGIDIAISTGLSDLQNLRFGFVPKEAPK